MSNNIFQIERTTATGVPVLRLTGTVDERAELESLGADIGTEVWLDVGGIRRVNSIGVRMWVEAMRAIPETVPMYFIHCSTSVIDQCNLVLGFLGHGNIVSFYAPLICEDCNEQQTQLFTTAACLALDGRLPTIECPECHEPMELDDFEEHYLHFLQREPADLPRPPY